MPELPEVEAARRLIESHCAGMKVTAAETLEAGGHARTGEFDSIVFDDADTSGESVTSALVGRTLVGVRRKGKQLWLEMSSPPHLLAHFGMTGAFVIQGVAPMSYQEFKVHDDEWPPRFTKLELVFDGGAKRLAFCDPRRLGRLRLRAEPELQDPWKALAPDALVEPVGRERAQEALRKTGAPIKALLLDQAKLTSGVGNWVADEVLFQAGIHPEATCNTLSEAQVGKLCDTLHDVVSTAVAVNAEAGSALTGSNVKEWKSHCSAFPEQWLFHYRWGKGGKSAVAPKVPGPNGGPITFITVGGRTSAVVVARQRKGELSAPAKKEKKPAKKQEKEASAGGKEKGKKKPAAANVPSPSSTRGSKRAKPRAADDDAGDEAEEEEEPTSRRGGAKKRSKYF